METLSINKTYTPLINKVLEFDNYEKIKIIVNVGINGLEYVENYVKHNENNFLFENEIKNYEMQIENLNNIIQNTKKQLLETQEDHFKEINDIKNKSFEKLMKMQEKYKEEQEKYKEEFETKLENIKKDMEEKYVNEINENKRKNETLNNEIIKIKNESFETLMNLQEKYNEQSETKIENIKKEKQDEINYFKDLINKQEEKNKDNLINELEKVRIEKDKIIKELEKENKTYKEKYDPLNLKSVKKGKPYEDALEEELINLFEIKDNSFSIKKRSESAGKGDFVITNHYSGIRIMMEAKNMPIVSSTVKDQLPKYFKNLKDKTNNYDGGFIVSSGRVQTKKNYDIELIDNKVSGYIENYNLNNPEQIYFILNMIHEKIKEQKSERKICEKDVLTMLVDNYKEKLYEYTRLKQVYENQYNSLMNIKNRILTMFNIDVDEYISDKKKYNENFTKNINIEIMNYIEEEREKNSKLNKTQLVKITKERFKKYVDLYNKGDKINGISNNKITKLVNEILKQEEIVINT